MMYTHEYVLQEGDQVCRVTHSVFWQNFEVRKLSVRDQVATPLTWGTDAGMSCNFFRSVVVLLFELFKTECCARQHAQKCRGRIISLSHSPLMRWRLRLWPSKWMLSPSSLAPCFAQMEMLGKNSGVSHWFHHQLYSQIECCFHWRVE